MNARKSFFMLAALLKTVLCELKRCTCSLRFETLEASALMQRERSTNPAEYLGFVEAYRRFSCEQTPTPTYESVVLVRVAYAAHAVAGDGCWTPVRNETLVRKPRRD
jgi:hypothetical protein